MKFDTSETSKTTKINEKPKVFKRFCYVHTFHILPLWELILEQCSPIFCGFASKIPPEGPFGSPLGPLGAILGALLASLGPPWDPPGTSLAPS